MSDHTPFLLQIVRHPADPGPRLVYADFLEERGRGKDADFLRQPGVLELCRWGDDGCYVTWWHEKASLFERMWGRSSRQGFGTLLPAEDFELFECLLCNTAQWEYRRGYLFRRAGWYCALCGLRVQRCPLFSLAKLAGVDDE